MKGQLLVVTAIVTAVGIVCRRCRRRIVRHQRGCGGAAATAAEAVATEAACRCSRRGGCGNRGRRRSRRHFHERLAAAGSPRGPADGEGGGALFVLGTVSNADSANPSVGAVDAIRVVPVGEFELFGTPIAGSGPDTVISPVLHSLEATRGKFELGSFVQYDGTEHIVIGQIAVR
jgi:hypothetical protein